MNRRLALSLLLAFACLRAPAAHAQIQHYAIVPPAPSTPGTLALIHRVSDGEPVWQAGSDTGHSEAAAVSPDGLYFYVPSTEGVLRRVSVADGSVSDIATLGAGMAGAAVSPDGATIYVTQNTAMTRWLLGVNAATGAVDDVVILPVGGDLGDVVIAPDGARAFVLTSGQNPVVVVDLLAGAMQSTLVASGATAGLALSADGRYLFVTANETSPVTQGWIHTWDLASGSAAPVASTPYLGRQLGAIAISPDGQRAYVTERSGTFLLEIDLSAGFILDVATTIAMPTRVAVTANGSHVLAGTQQPIISFLLPYTLAPVPPRLGALPAVPTQPTGSRGLFVTPNLIESVPGPMPQMLDVANDAALTAMGFGRFLPFKEGVIRLTGDLATTRTVQLVQRGFVMLNAHSASLAGDIRGARTFAVHGPGRLDLQGANGQSSTQINQEADVTIAQRHPGVVELTSGAVQLGADIDGQLLATGGTVRLGLAPSTAARIALPGGSIGAAATLAIDLVASSGALACDTLAASSGIALSGTLALTLTGGAPAADSSCTIVENATGAFAGLPEGAIIQANGAIFRISYAGGVGFHVTLTTVPNLPPTISGGVDDTVVEGNPFSSQPITIGDDFTAPGAITLTARSSNQALVADAAIALIGTGATRTLHAAATPGVIGQTTITLTANDGTNSSMKTFLLTVEPNVITYHLAEGATGAFFDTDLLLANPSDAAARVRLDFRTAAGALVSRELTLDPQSRRTIRVDAIDGLESTTFATKVLSLDGTRLAVERTMTWDETAYGAHTERATDGPSRTLYFAEGAQGFFKTYFLLQNAAESTNVARLTFLLEGGGTLSRDYELPAEGRLTVDAGEIAELASRAFSTIVAFQFAGYAERSMYFGAQPFFAGGSGAAGVSTPARTWYLAEGATGGFFSTYLLAMNPTDEPAQATFTWLRESGGALASVTRTIPPNGRVTIDPSLESPSLAAATFATTVTSDQDIIVERSMYWPTSQWIESHASAAEPALDYAWALAEGRVGGAAGAQTFILLSNPNEAPASVTLRFLHDPADHGGQAQPPLTRTVTVPAGGRVTIAVSGVGSDVPELIDEAFGVSVDSDWPILVERSMYGSPHGAIWSSGTNAAGTRLFGRGPG